MMVKVFAFTTMIALTGVIGINSASAASGDAYKSKKAACEARAKTMKFGVHFVKKNRWVKDCIAGKHPA